jgi:DNA-binding NarL/FixJ family response regulator
MALRVVTADDSVPLREGIGRLLEEAGLEVAGQAGDGEDLLRKVGAHKPDVAVVDVGMPRCANSETRRCGRPEPSQARAVLRDPWSVRRWIARSGWRQLSRVRRTG